MIQKFVNRSTLLNNTIKKLGEKDLNTDLPINNPLGKKIQPVGIQLEPLILENLLLTKKDMLENLEIIKHIQNN